MKKESGMKRTTLFWFFVIAFLIPWLTAFFVGGIKSLNGDSSESYVFILIAVAMLIGPAISGIVFTRFVDGRHVFRNLYRLDRVHTSSAWWYFAILVFPITLLLVSFILFTGKSGEFSPTFFLPGIGIGLLAGFLEETGWTGFALQKMERYGIFRAGLIIGFLHGIWHGPADMITSARSMGVFWIPYFIAFIIFVIALRILIVWVYRNTGSLLLSQLMHASSTGFFAILIPMDLSPQNKMLFYSVYALALSAFSLIILKVYKRSEQKKSVSM